MSTSTKLWSRGLLLKALPPNLSALILALEAVLVSLTLHLDHKPLIVFGLPPTLLLNPLISKLIVGDKNMTLRRSFYIYLYLNTPLTLVLAADFAGKPPPTITLGIAVASTAIITYLLTVVIPAAFKADFKKAAAASTIFFATYIYYTTLGHPLPILLADLVATVLISLLVYNRILGIRVSSVSGIELINSFALSWMDRSSEAFDQVCRKLGENAELKVSIHEFVDHSGQRIATLIIPYIHPGPAKAIGSGELPTIIQRELRPYNPMVLHGASDHTLNMASRSDIKEIIQKIDQALKTSRDEFTQITKIEAATFTDKSVRLSAYRFDGNTLIFVSRNENTEDLPRRVAETVTTTLDIVDRHNTLCDEKTAHYTDQEVDELMVKIGSIVSEDALGEVEVEGVGYSNCTFTAQDVAPGGITALVLHGSKKLAVISIDANNLECGLNKTIEETIKGMGYDFCEVTTTDNHWNSGVTRRYPGYYPGGAISKERLVAATAECVASAEKNLRPALYRKSIVTFKTVVFGERLGEMYRALNAGRRTIFFGGLSALIVSLALLVLL